MRAKSYSYLKFCFLYIIFLAGCAGRLAVQRDYDFESIRNIAVAGFKSSEGSEAAGDAVRDIFTKSFLESGISVVDSKAFDKMLAHGSPQTPQMFAEIGALAGADAILDGSIYRYLPEKEERIYYASEDGKIGYETAFYNAKVALTARLVDVKTGAVVWVNSDYYESFDIQRALEGAVYTVLRPLKNLISKNQ
ncbi:MAG: CsgG/HfaB family protein [bacterium]